MRSTTAKARSNEFDVSAQTQVEGTQGSVPKHVMIMGGLAQSLTNFRGPLIQKLLGQGHRVTAVAGNDDDKVRKTLNGWGAEFTSVGLVRAGMNPLADVGTLLNLHQLMTRKRPDVYLGYTIKPVIYGLVAARRAGVPRRIAMITGLGYAFTDGLEWKRAIAHVIARTAYKLSLKMADKVIFQNPDDEEYFLERNLVSSRKQTALVNGSGVDLDHFTPAAFPGGPISFLMIARLLRDKGVLEYVEAARMVKRQHPDARFVLAGPLDPNPSAIQEKDVMSWVKEGIIEYRGEVQDVRPEIANCHVYVLPSYREGTPRTVLEAMAMGRPIITTDVPGCRQTIEDGCSGFLVNPRNGKDIAQAMRKYLLNPVLLEKMGKESQQRAGQMYDQLNVTLQILSHMNINARANA